MRLLSIHFEHLSILWRPRQRPYDGDVYYYIGKRLQHEGETENVRMSVSPSSFRLQRI